MLEQLDKLEGVQSSSANHTGKIVRITVAHGANEGEVADKALKVLKENGSKPSLIEHDRADNALNEETWRGIERIGELSAIEFRTITIGRVREFAKTEKLDRDVTDKLVALAEGEWDQLMQGVDPKVPPHKADWNGRCRAFAAAFTQKAKSSLSAAQYYRLKEAVKCELGE